MLRIEQDNKLFIDSVDQLAPIYSQAFAGSPWFEEIPVVNARRLLSDSAERNGFSSFVAFYNGKLAGVSWMDTPKLETLIQPGRNDRLVRIVKEIYAKYEELPLVYVRDTLVKPEFQGQGIAGQLKSTYLRFLEDSYINGALILTRHREDNEAILRSSLRHGFKPTGVRFPTSVNPNINHEFWYRLVNCGDE